MNANFDYQHAMKLKSERRYQVGKWKRVKYLFKFELVDELKKLNCGDALADAIDEMSNEEIVELIRRLMKVIRRSN
jgi:hypothetical protein